MNKYSSCAHDLICGRISPVLGLSSLHSVDASFRAESGVCDFEDGGVYKAGTIWHDERARLHAP